MPDPLNGYVKDGRTSHVVPPYFAALQPHFQGNGLAGWVAAPTVSGVDSTGSSAASHSQQLSERKGLVYLVPSWTLFSVYLFRYIKHLLTILLILPCIVKSFRKFFRPVQVLFQNPRTVSHGLHGGLASASFFSARSTAVWKAPRSVLIWPPAATPGWSVSGSPGSGSPSGAVHHRRQGGGSHQGHPVFPLELADKPRPGHRFCKKPSRGRYSSPKSVE